MNYMEHYNKLCESRARSDRQKGLGEYFESHHVFPKSVCGDNPVLVLLTAREHYVAHWLIWKAYQHKFGDDNWRTVKMANAFWRTCNGNPEVSKRSKNSRAYEVSKQAWSQAMAALNKNPSKAVLDGRVTQSLKLSKRVGANRTELQKQADRKLGVNQAYLTQEQQRQVASEYSLKNTTQNALAKKFGVGRISIRTAINNYKGVRDE